MYRLNPWLWLVAEPAAGGRSVLGLPMRVLCSLTFALPAFGAQADLGLTNLASSQSSPIGAAAYVVLAQGSDGNFYGTSYSGGTNGYYYRAVFLGSDGTVLDSGTNGAEVRSDPSLRLRQGCVEGFDGPLYRGGASEAGTASRRNVIEQLPPVFQAPVLTNNTLSFSWSTEPGRTYQLQHCSDSSSRNWTDLGGAVIAAGTSLSVIDYVTNRPRRFYRVVLLP